MNEKKQKIKKLIDLWAEFENIGVDCSGVFSFLSIQITEYLDQAISEIYEMIHAADFQTEDIKIKKVHDLINQINNHGMDYITSLEGFVGLAGRLKK